MNFSNSVEAWRSIVLPYANHGTEAILHSVREHIEPRGYSLRWMIDPRTLESSHADGMIISIPNEPTVFTFLSRQKETPVDTTGHEAAHILQRVYGELPPDPPAELTNQLVHRLDTGNIEAAHETINNLKLSSPETRQKAVQHAIAEKQAYGLGWGHRKDLGMNDDKAAHHKHGMKAWAMTQTLLSSLLK